MPGPDQIKVTKAWVAISIKSRSESVHDQREYSWFKFDKIDPLLRLHSGPRWEKLKLKYINVLYGSPESGFTGFIQDQSIAQPARLANYIAFWGWGHSSFLFLPLEKRNNFICCFIESWCNTYFHHYIYIPWKIYDAKFSPVRSPELFIGIQNEKKKMIIW